MTRYVMLLKFTDEGIGKIKDSLAREEAFKAAAQQAGVTVESAYWTLGEYDGIAILRGPDEAAVAATVLSLAKLGHVRSTLLRAFDAAEFKSILNRLQ
jgi:uncharacterized protein with GYD domain